MKILVVGDSIAAGDTVPSGSQWYRALTDELSLRQPPVAASVVTVARGGTGLAYAEEAVAGVDLSTVQVAFVLVGIQDAEEVFSTGAFDEADYRARYERLVQRLAGSGRRVIVATFPPSLTDDTRFLDAHQTEMAALIRDVSGPDVLDLWTVFHDAGPAMVRTLYTDNYHPNVEGQALISRLVAAELERRGVLPCS